MVAARRYPARWWLAQMRGIAATYGRESSAFAIWADLARSDGYELPAKFSGGAKKHRPRPARDALIEKIARRRSNKEAADWWQKTVEAFMDRAAKDVKMLYVVDPAFQPKRADVAAAYREWLFAVEDSITAIFIGNYSRPRLEKARRGSPPKWTGKYVLVIPKSHTAAHDDVALWELKMDLASQLPDWQMTSRGIRRIRRRLASSTS